MLVSFLQKEIPRHWEKRLYKVLFVLFAGHCTLMSSKPPQMDGGAAGASAEEAAQGGAVAVPVLPPEGGAASAAAPAAGETVAEATPAGPCRVVFQSVLAADGRCAAAFAGEPGWRAPVAELAAPRRPVLVFDGGASPARFAGLTNVAVRALAVAAAGAADGRATLVDGPEPVRPLGGGGAGALRIFEAGFAVPVPVAGLFFGGGAGRPGWRRGWRGGIAEVVGFDGTPDDDLRAGVMNYLAVRWGLAGHPATAAQRRTAIEAGLRHGTAWGTAVILR